jgi:hypothetical protein
MESKSLLIPPRNQLPSGYVHVEHGLRDRDNEYDRSTENCAGESWANGMGDRRNAHDREKSIASYMPEADGVSTAGAEASANEFGATAHEVDRQRDSESEEQRRSRDTTEPRIGHESNPRRNLGKWQDLTEYLGCWRREDLVCSDLTGERHAVARLTQTSQEKYERRDHNARSREIAQPRSHAGQTILGAA